MPYRLYDKLPLFDANKTRAQIDTSALIHNFNLLRKLTARDAHAPRPIAVLKADAYGHGVPLCVPPLLEAGCDFFAVANLSEAISVRRVCREADRTADILILGYTEPSLAPMLAAHDLIQTLLSVDYAHTLAQAALANGVCVRAHVAADTGMHRIGLDACSPAAQANSANAIVALCALKSLHVEGIFSHFSRADEPKSPLAVMQSDLQADRFAALCALVKEQGICLFRHLCNSAGSVTRHLDYADGVRFGIALYGINPLSGIGLDLRPVMCLQTAVVHLHTLPAGESLGYGGDFSASETRQIATLPIGYADGLLRACTGASVTLHSQSGTHTVPIVGRICMDQCMLDVTHTNAALGDTVTLFGLSPDQLPSLARHAHTIPYELLTAISPRVPRLRM